jgi:sugar phosphate isomerase/epimerase
MRRFSICNFTLAAAPFETQVRLLSDAGVPGMGICESMLPGERSSVELARELSIAGLKATICITETVSPLPLVHFAGPNDPEERVLKLQSAIRRLAPFEPEAVAILTGPEGDRDIDAARSVAVEGIARVAEVAREEGVTLALEPIHRLDRQDWSLVSDIPGALSILEETGDDTIGLLVDSFNLWDSPDVERHIRDAGRRIVAVHIHDWSADRRSWADRQVMGDGMIDLAGFIRAAEAAGFTGTYDCEIFSDDGRLGVAEYPDSLWSLPPEELVTRCVRAWGDLARAAGIEP